MKLKGRELREIIWEEHDDWQIIADEITEHTRWSVRSEAICRHIPTDKYYLIPYSVGATEHQDERPFEYVLDEDVEIYEVVKKEITTYKWVRT